MTNKTSNRAQEKENFKMSSSLRFSMGAHAKLKLLKKEVSPGISLTIPEVINGILENVTIAQARELLKETISAKRAMKAEKGVVTAEVIRMKRLLNEMSLSELEALVAEKNKARTEPAESEGSFEPSAA